MRFSIVVPDEVIETIRARAEKTGISQTEFCRRAVFAACTSDAPPHTSPAHLTDDERTSMKEAIQTAEDQARTAAAEVERLYRERDQDRAEIRTMDETIKKLREDLDREKSSHIADLQSTLGVLTRKTPPALPETAGPGRQGFIGWLASLWRGDK